MYRKTEQITIRVNPVLKDKFMVSIGFLNATAVFTSFMQEKVREYEQHINDMKPIPVRTDKQGIYDLITQIHGVKITKEKFDEISALYPKTRKNIALYGE